MLSIALQKILLTIFPLVTAMMTWFDEKKISIAMGFAAAGSCLGGIVYIVLIRTLIVQQGFATTMIVIGSLAAITIIPANLVFRVRGKRYIHSLYCDC